MVSRAPVSSSPVPLNPVPQRIDRVLRGAAGAVALIDRAGAMSFAEADAMVDAIAAGLAHLAPGDRVATWLPKTRVACLIPLAAARAGLVHVPINPALKRAQVGYILGDSGAVVLVTQPARAGTLAAGDLPVGCVVVDEGSLGRLRRGEGLAAGSDGLEKRDPRFGEGDGVGAAGGALVRHPREGGDPSPGDLSGGAGETGPRLRGDDGDGDERAAASGHLREGEGDGIRGGDDGDTDDLAAILYTSGSTGRPKGVMLSHANLWLGAVSVAHYLRLSPGDRVLGVLPLSFDYGQNQLFSTWYAGASYAPIDYLVAKDVVAAVERTGATTLAGVPPLWVQLLECDWPAATAARLKRLTNSGGALTPRLVRGLRARFPAAALYPMYGLTEAFRSTYLDPALVDAHPDAIGRAIPFAEVSVRRADGSRAAPDEAGELVHAGPLVAQGYWRDPARTAARFRPEPDGRPAVWSGDTVIEGEDGLLRFVGRGDEMMKVAGNRISPLEIEEVVVGDYGSDGAVREAVAIGVADARTGQAIVVVAAGGGAVEAAVRAKMRRELPSFMQPARYVWRAELPRNANGKLDRAALAAEMRGVTA